MNIAAIDIGSNASRLLIKSTEGGLKESYDATVRPGFDYLTRVPMQLGMDVYANGNISKERTEDLARAMKQFRLIMAACKVKQWRACATASLRDAGNRQEVVDRVEAVSGIHVEIISGEEEARLVRDSYFAQVQSRPHQVLFTDVGGGSTDVCLTVDGKVIFTRSFPVGSMRIVCGSLESDALPMLSQQLRRLSDVHGQLHVVGSGGSIRKICELCPNTEHPRHVTYETLDRLYHELEPLTVDEKMARYHLSRDRAEIIAEAAQIYHTIASATGAPFIEAAPIGVRDGIIVNLLKNL